MNLDKNGLPVQANGDANDQLARASELAVAALLMPAQVTHDTMPVALNCLAAVQTSLQPHYGSWVRYIGAPTDSTSADQIVSVSAVNVIAKDHESLIATGLRMFGRLGFAQNYRNTLDGSDSLQLPDFMLLRILPLLSRVSLVLYPAAVVADILLLCAALAAIGPVWTTGKGFTARTPDDVDDNVLILTLIACSARMPTPLSWLARKLYGKYRATNDGCALTTPPCNPVIGAMLWYHRAAAGGNPEVAQALIPLINAYILE